MAFEKFSYDPFSGVTTYFDYDDDTDTTIFRREQDVSGVLEYAAAARKNAPTSVIGRGNEEWMLEAIVPNMIQVEMLKKGIDINNPAHVKDVAREIETNYPYLKCTEMKLWRPT